MVRVEVVFKRKDQLSQIKIYFILQHCDVQLINRGDCIQYCKLLRENGESLGSVHKKRPIVSN